jgi:alkanesulfonate monooxygenase SsuD/methylene tetrahydromethanopterin reductase-like flavin-dependent oxidoreductase (luciferase family)
VPPLRRRIEFGYNPPTGLRQVERFAPDARTFIRDLHDVLDFASQHFSSLWFSDHLMTVERFRMECWTELTWAAARYPGPLLGTIVMANNYRPPALMAKMAATLQHFSRGRLVVGYGAGWHEDEYRGYGYEFPSASVRIAQMVEGIQIMKAMWSQSPVSFDGRYYQIHEAVNDPLPEPPPLLMIGGDGERLTLRAVAEYADWWNSVMRPKDVLRHKIAVLEDHCRAVGRDPSSVRRTITQTVYLARSGEEARRWAGERLERDQPPFAGDPAALVDHLHELSELGFDLFQMVFAGFPDTTDMRLFIDEVMPAFY